LKTNQSGFTLLEVLVALAIISILVALTIPSYNNFWGNSENKSVARSILNTFRSARALAVSQNRPIVTTIDLDNHKMTYDTVNLVLSPNVKLEADDDITSLEETGTKSVTFEPQGSVNNKLFIRVDGNPDLTVELNLNGISKL
jgi:prepilin-type N-terminal cleavage/methylation domain-containing protein